MTDAWSGLICVEMTIGILSASLFGQINYILPITLQLLHVE